MLKTIRLSFLVLLPLFTMQVVFAEECSPLGQPVESSQNCCMAPLNAFPVVALDGVCRQKPALCAGRGVTPVDDQVCCVGLNNVEGVCKDPSPVDPTIVSCETNPSVCTGGTGCFPQRSEDLFSSQPQNETELNTQEQMTSEIENTEEFARADGQYCIKNSHCSSYNCVNMACAVTKICRKADEGEVAGTAQCEDGLNIDPVTGKCKLAPSTSPNGTSIGPTDPTRDPTNQCRFNFPDQMKLRAEYAIRQTRAMEWFLNSITTQDCFRVHNYLKSIGVKFVEKRKLLLKTFNEDMSKIDGDMKILLASKDKDADPDLVVTFKGQPITNKQLAGRLTSGVDMVQAMISRNEAFKKYEQGMKELSKITSQRIKVLSDLYEQGVSGWGDHQSRHWKVPRENSVSSDGLTADISLINFHGNDQLTCRGGGFLGLARRRVYKRWHHQHLFSSTVFRDINIKEELAQIVYPEKITGVVYNPVLKKDVLDTAAAQSTLSSSMNLTNGRLLYALDEVNSLRDLASVRNSVSNFIAALKSDGSVPEFNHEPELLPYKAKNCTYTSTDSACSDFKAFIDSVSKTAYAQTYAFKTHKRSNYKFFFNGDVMRKKLIKGWWGRLDDLSNYYTSMVTYRDQQNECLNNLEGQANEFLDNSAAGINEGAQNYYQGSDYVTAPSTTTGNSQAAGPKSISQAGFEFQASLLSPMSVNNNTNLPGAQEAASGAGSSTLSNASSASQATRVKSAADLAASKDGSSSNSVGGSKSSNGSAVAASGMSGAGGGAGMGSSSSDSSNSMNASAAGKAGLMDEINGDKSGVKTGSGTDADGSQGLVKGNGSGANGLGAGLGAGAGYGNGGFSGGVGSGSAAGTDANAGKDPTGMSDEEKDVMMANFERTKSRYDTKEDDSLFTIINKTYVRNLDKILKKKPTSSPE